LAKLATPPPGTSHAELRRTVARLRSGQIHSLDPRFPSQLLANLIEESIVQDLVIKQIGKEGREYSQMRHEMDARYEAERARRPVTAFHTLKKSPEAADPEAR
jgi:hypothetical protein